MNETASDTADDRINGAGVGNGHVGDRDGVGTDDHLDAAEASAATAMTPLRTRGRFDRGLFVASLTIAVGVVLIVWGFTVAVTGDDGIDRPDAIESLQPVENAVQVLQQDRVVVDLEAGYEAALVIDGIELETWTIGEVRVEPADQAEPGQQVDLPTTAVFDRGNAVISFQPVEGAPIESFEQGIHEVRVIFWRVEDGRDQALSYRWEFEVV